MASIHIRGVTSITPDQFITALTDFGPHRSKIWANSQPKYLVVHGQGHTNADVTEGSGIFGGVWERVHYDWSDPRSISLRTVDSNFWTNASNWHYVVTSSNNGQTVIDYDITREAKNLQGKFAMILVGLLGKRVLQKDFERSLRAIELYVQKIN